MVRGGGRTPFRDAVGLLDESDAGSFCERDLGDGDEVRRGDSSRGSVPEDQRSSGVLDLVQMCLREPVRCLDLDDGHRRMLPRLRGQTHGSDPQLRRTRGRTT